MIVVPAGARAVRRLGRASQQWQTVLLWLNRVPFGKDDPQFGIDIGFFVFTLPWLRFLLGFLTAVVVPRRARRRWPRTTSTAACGCRAAGPRTHRGAPGIHLAVLRAAFLLLQRRRLLARPVRA